MSRSEDDDPFLWPYIGGMGTLHDVDDSDPLPRLYGLRSVSKEACWALKRRPNRARVRPGFL